MRIDPGDIGYKQIYKLMVSVIVPRPIAFVSTVDRNGQPNLAPFSYFTACSSNPPCVVFSPTPRGSEATVKDTLRNVRETGEFVVNVVSESFVEQMNQCSAEFPPEVNEFAISGLHPLASERVSAPRVAESAVQMECKLRQVVTVSEAPGGGYLVIGEVVLFHVNDAVAINGDGVSVDPGGLDAVGRMGGPTYVRTRDRFKLERPKL